MVYNLNTLINKKCINHTPTKPAKKIQWGVPFQWSHRLTAYNFPRNKPPKKHLLQSLLKREEDRLFRTSFVDTYDKDIILKQKLVISQLSQKTRTIYHLENLLSSKLNRLLSQKITRCCLKSGFWVCNWRQHKRNLHWKRRFTYLLALISRSNLTFVKSSWTFTPFFNSFLFIVRDEML